MESLDLNTLAKSLPNASLARAEDDLSQKFKDAALSITNLYRSSRNTSKKAYNAGYAAACSDLLTMIQQGVSGSEEMTIGRVMDWIEGRLEAIQARGEEEDEDEEKERGKRPLLSSSVPSRPSIRPIDQPIAAPSAPPAVLPATARAPSSSPPPQAVITPRSHNRTTKQRSVTSQLPSVHLSDASNEAPSSSNPTAILSDLTAGTKRRHAVMVMLDSASQPVPLSVEPATIGAASVPARRRTRSGRGGLCNNVTPSRDRDREKQDESLMDVEDDNGRERKRVARR